jgi:hypothetical protein|tara:strand:- start:15543 stop:15830 length:288 start_codon:yes stop_codon:yes gene_type:complete
MKDYVETNAGKAYFDNNPHFGDKLEISSWMNTMREQLLSCMNLWYRSADYDEDHKKLYSKTLDEFYDLRETTSKVEQLLKNYISDKKGGNNIDAT